jgi:hypothetical protein
MHDTIEFEKRGIPPTVMLTQACINAAVFPFRAKGMAGHPSVMLPHPISNLVPEALRQATRPYVAQVVPQLIA